MSKQLTIVTYFDEHDKTLLELDNNGMIIPGVGEHIHIKDTMYVVKSIDHTFKGEHEIVHHINIYTQDYFNSIMV